MEPFLDSINHMLMQEDDLEDASCILLQRDCDGLYQTILRSFYNIIGVEHLPPTSKSERTDTSLLPNLARHHVLNHPNSAALSSTEVQYYHTAIDFNFNYGQFMDIKLSCCEKHRALNSSRSSCGWGSNAQFQLPSPYKELSLGFAGVELSFEDLKLHNHYAALYVGEPGIDPTRPPNKETTPAVACKCRGKSGKKRTAIKQEYVDLRDLIVKCGQAVAEGNARVANVLLQDIQQVYGASADGNGSQRAAHYFSEVLVARMRGTGAQRFRAVLNEKPCGAARLKSYKHCFEVCPMVKATHYFANQSILKVAGRASRLHIVDYGEDQCGMQWPFLINALADQKGGPPLLVITSIGFPQPGNNPVGRLEETGRRLAAHARTYNVPFQFHAIASSKWEDLDSSSFHFHEDEVLVVNCIMSLRHLADNIEGLDLLSPRQQLLRCIHTLKPHLLITADVNAAYNSSFFASRFREALSFYSNLFDMFDTLWGDHPRRLQSEKTFYREILNIVACEGAERVERAETYKQWEVCIKRAGFEQLPMPPAILCRSRWHVKQHYHKEFFVHDDGNKWMLLGWRGRTVMAISAWKLSHAQSHML